jgi:hypothetical protein
MMEYVKNVLEAPRIWDILQLLLSSSSSSEDDFPPSSSIHHHGRRLKDNNQGVLARVLIEVGVRVAFLIVPLLIIGLHYAVVLLVCTIGWCTPVSDADENDDVSWCCGTGAFCCVAQAKIPPMRVNKAKHVLCLILDIVAFQFLNIHGVGLALLGATHIIDPASPGGSSAVGKQWLIVGAVYAGICFANMIAGGFLFPLSIFFYWAWVASIAATTRLCCKKRYSAKYFHDGGWGFTQAPPVHHLHEQQMVQTTVHVVPATIVEAELVPVVGAVVDYPPKTQYQDNISSN